MNQSTSGWRLAAVCAVTAATALPALAEPVVFSGTRSNATPGGTLGGRCGATTLTISFAPGAFAASGTSTLGDFEYTASHCIAGFPPGPYTDGLFSWDFGDDTLVGTYSGFLTAGSLPGQFNISEALTFTGGTGRFAGATGEATFSGLLRFGAVGGVPASFGDGSFSGTLHLAAVPEPGTWALMLAGVAALGAVRRRGGAGG